MRTLVVEDEKHLNRMISEAILDEGYSVDSCFNGLEARAFANARIRRYRARYNDAERWTASSLCAGCALTAGKTPVVYLYWHATSVSDKVRGLESGGGITTW